jgi:hypothetical protein
MTHGGFGTTTDGRAIDEAMVERLAAQAEAGFPGVTFTKPRTGRPWLSGSGPSGTRTVRLPAGLDAALLARARAENTTPSQVIREALQDYLALA